MTHISTTTVTTHKPHVCWGCTKEFPARSKMERTVSSDEGKLNVTYWCLSCSQALSEYQELIDPYNDGITYGELSEFLQDLIGKV